MAVTGSAGRLRLRRMPGYPLLLPLLAGLMLSAGQAVAAGLPRLSSSFGYRDDPILGTRAMHRGVDIPGREGTPVHAAASGVVRFAGSAGGYGQMIEIDHGDGLTTRYAHLSRILIRPGAPVVQGQTIALMGSTGRSTGSHLHFEVREYGQAEDPLRFFGTQVAPAKARPLASEPHISAFARARDAAGQDWGAGL